MNIEVKKFSSMISMTYVITGGRFVRFFIKPAKLLKVGVRASTITYTDKSGRCEQKATWAHRNLSKTEDPALRVLLPVSVCIGLFDGKRNQSNVASVALDDNICRCAGLQWGFFRRTSI
jgi:hypothetical protein